MMDAAPTLPTGGCNFRDLAQGVALNCGCQKFWPYRKRRKGGGRTPNPQESKGKETNRIPRITEAPEVGDNDALLDDDSEDEDCRCGHHACFHSFGSPVSVRTQSTGRRYSLQISDTETSVRLDRSGANLAASGFSITSGTTTERDYSTTDQSPSIVAARNIKPHPYQPSNLSSRSSASKTSQVTNRGDSKLDDVLRGVASILEVFSAQQKNTTQGSAVSTSIFPSCSAELTDISEKLSKLIEYTEKLQESSRSHHERLETVETFGSVLEEIRDKVELAEDRANEVEEKVFSFENRLDDRLAPIESLLKSHSEKRKSQDDENRARKRHKTTELSSSQEIPLTSFTSTSTSVSESTTAHILTILTEIRTRLIDLESTAPPSPSRPWIISIVLLPPAPLRGIWTDPSSPCGYESSNPQSVSTLSGTRRKPDHDGPLPRSFGINSRLYRRLNSRGFIKTLSIPGPTAHDVASAIGTDFSHLLDWCGSFYSTPASPAEQKVAGLGAWQPLRKVHKQTTLEFLKIGEMVEAMWTVEFLKGSCVMRGRRKVLYITPVVSGCGLPYEGVGWADVKALPETVGVVEDGVDRVESGDCWEWKEALDGVVGGVVEGELELEGEGELGGASWSSFGPFQMEDERVNQGHTPPETGEREERRSPEPLESPVGGVRGGRVQRRVWKGRQAPGELVPAVAVMGSEVGGNEMGLGLGELSSENRGWFMENPVLEEEGEINDNEDEEEELTQPVPDGEEGYGSLEA